jgi:hypothetical protein
MPWRITFGDASQSGEGIALLYIFNKIGTINKLAVDIGASDGHTQSNTQLLEKVSDFRRLMFDIAPENPVVIEMNITAENVSDVLRTYGVPEDFDLLSIDIDGNDYWVWKALEFRPRVVVIEYNRSLGCIESKTIAYNPEHMFNADQYYGASAPALMKLGHKLGYKCVARHGTNMIFVRKELVTEVQELVLPNSGPLQGQARGWPDAPKGSKWILV